ncbi:hypothetical protein CBL_08106 [Carabus blaptoides fortunei]
MKELTKKKKKHKKLVSIKERAIGGAHTASIIDEPKPEFRKFNIHFEILIIPYRATGIPSMRKMKRFQVYKAALNYNYLKCDQTTKKTITFFIVPLKQLI